MRAWHHFPTTTDATRRGLRATRRVTCPTAGAAVRVAPCIARAEASPQQRGAVRISGPAAGVAAQQTRPRLPDRRCFSLPAFAFSGPLHSEEALFLQKPANSRPRGRHGRRRRGHLRRRGKRACAAGDLPSQGARPLFGRWHKRCAARRPVQQSSRQPTEWAARPPRSALFAPEGGMRRAAWKHLAPAGRNAVALRAGTPSLLPLPPILWHSACTTCFSLAVTALNAVVFTPKRS
eukprot:307712-Chlamydomonas_euryale.AAC.3